MLGAQHAAVAPGTPRTFANVLLALGIITAPGRETLIRDIRQTWLQRSNVPSDVAVRIVIDAGAQLRETVFAQGLDDVLVVNYTGPVSHAAAVKQLVWFAWAVDAFPSASFISKCEDDVFIHLPSLRSALLTERLHESALTAVSLFRYFCWVEAAGCPIAFGFFALEATQKRKLACRSKPELCDGPFPFPVASFVALSPELARRVVQTPPAARALALMDGHGSLALARAFPSCSAVSWKVHVVAHGLSDGRIATKFRDLLADDVWLGWLMHRHLADAPLRLYDWNNPLHMDNTLGRGRVDQATMVFHDKSKSALFLQQYKLPPDAPPGKVFDVYWSRARRAYHFARFRHCPPNVVVTGENDYKRHWRWLPPGAWPAGWRMFSLGEDEPSDAAGERPCRRWREAPRRQFFATKDSLALAFNASDVAEVTPYLEPDADADALLSAGLGPWSADRAADASLRRAVLLRSGVPALLEANRTRPAPAGTAAPSKPSLVGAHGGAAGAATATASR